MKPRIIALVVGTACVAAAIIYLSQTEEHFRGETLHVALGPVAGGGDPDKALAAKAILGNYTETRQIAALWSGLYWGFAWTAAALGTLSGLILKLESFVQDEKAKKDIAATLTVTAAIMITVSTGGDFQRKWQANRAAAARLEQLGYEFLGKQGANPRQYFERVSEILMQRHMTILGTTDKLPVPVDRAASQSS